MNPSEHKTYWKNAAIRHKSIAHVDETSIHFCTFGPEAVLTELKNINSPMIALQEPEYSPIDNDSDNVMLQLNGGALILKKCNSADWTQIEAAGNEMFEIAWDMVTKLKNDRRKAFDSAQPSPENLIKHLQLNSIRLTPVGPVFDGWFGWIVNHVISTNKSDQLDESKWEDETKWTF